MASSLYQKAVQEMLTAHEPEFSAFREIHTNFQHDQTRWKAQFDQVGKPILRIIEETENRLCSKMENSGRGTYSANLSDKFRAEVRKIFPLVDFIGVTIS